MKGGVVPTSCQELQGLITEVQTQFGAFPIQSQHEGNCASDAIQIILYFSDGIGMRASTSTIEAYKTGAIPQNIYDESTMHAGINPSADVDSLARSYVNLTAVRFLRLIDEYRARIGTLPTGAPGERRLARAESAGPDIMKQKVFAFNLAPTENIQTPGGVLCSSVFATYQNKLKNVKDILEKPGQRNMLYPYSQVVYDPIVTRFLNAFAPGSMLLPGRVTQQINKYDIPNEIKDLSPYKNRIVGVQLFCKVNWTGGFHTFALFRRSGRWYIGDNEVGFSIPIDLTIDQILNGRISFEAIRRPEEPMGKGSRVPYIRTYFYHTVNPDGSLVLPGTLLRREEYYLPKSSSSSYDRAYEDTSYQRPIMYGMPRKYFIAPEGQPNCPGPAPVPMVVDQPINKEASIRERDKLEGQLYELEQQLENVKTPDARKALSKQIADLQDRIMSIEIQAKLGGRRRKTHKKRKSQRKRKTRRV